MVWNDLATVGGGAGGGVSSVFPCPEFAGIVAMADQLADTDLGTLNDGLYRLSHQGLVDITEGNNTFGPFTNSDGKTHTVQGFDARRGYDLASSLGTVDAPRLVTTLVTAVELARASAPG